jgi:ApbE superfamily uncharacterized protein (UPF0280 family)
MNMRLSMRLPSSRPTKLLTTRTRSKPTRTRSKPTRTRGPRSVTAFARIGHSSSRGRAVTVIVLQAERSLFAATAFPTTGGDLRTFIDMTAEQADGKECDDE